jgi:hypothetical protein
MMMKMTMKNKMMMMMMMMKTPGCRDIMTGTTLQGKTENVHL